MYMYEYLYSISAYMHICIFAHLYSTCIYTCVRIYVCTCVCVYAYVHVCVCMYAHKHIYIHTYIDVYMYVYVYMYIDTCTSSDAHIYKTKYIHVHLIALEGGMRHVCSGRDRQSGNDRTSPVSLELGITLRVQAVALDARCPKAYNLLCWSSLSVR